MNNYNLVRKAMLKLIAKNTTTTSLEVKTRLIKKYPDINWIQSFVSACMNDFYLNETVKELSFVDNGSYREYFLMKPYVKPVSNNSGATVVNRREAIELFKNHKGRFMGCTFIKKNGKKRTLNFRPFSGDNFLKSGRVQGTDSKGQYKQVDMTTLIGFTQHGKVYECI